MPIATDKVLALQDRMTVIERSEKGKTVISISKSLDVGNLVIRLFQLCNLFFSDFTRSYKKETTVMKSG